MSFFENRVILVTGCCGTVGKELVKQLVTVHNVKNCIGIDNNDSELFFMTQIYPEVMFFLADIRDKDRLLHLFQGVDVVFHAAAYKHVVLCEQSPTEAIQTNINGVSNIIQAAKDCKVGKVVFTSSDKAVNPTNVMGTSKLMGERLMSAANNSIKENETIFVSTRFGNVLGSRGSVIPIFRDQIKNGGPITLTDPAMTRFIMSINQATQLVIDSCIQAKGGEVFVTKMPVIRILDLAQVLINKLSLKYGYKPEDIQIVTIGSKPGEKLYEELLSDEEMRRSFELDKYFVVLPAFRNIYRAIKYEYTDIISESICNPYNSANESVLTHEELDAFLSDNDILNEK